VLPHTEHEDPRRAKSRARVLAAAVELLREEGLVGMTIESVAQRSGVAKTTIYRQFADRDALHHAAISSVACAVSMEHTHDVIADVTKFCTGLNQKLRTGDFGAVLPTGFDGAERSETLARMLHDTGSERRAALLERLRAAARDGQLRADIDVDLVNSQLVGPLFYRRFMSRQPVSPAWVAKLVRAVLSPLACQPAGGLERGARPRSTR
jgi:AcrR family transcriptional regulator